MFDSPKRDDIFHSVTGGCPRQRDGSCSAAWTCKLLTCMFMSTHNNAVKTCWMAQFATEDWTQCLLAAVQTKCEPAWSHTGSSWDYQWTFKKIKREKYLPIAASTNTSRLESPLASDVINYENYRERRSQASLLLREHDCKWCCRLSCWTFSFINFFFFFCFLILDQAIHMPVFTFLRRHPPYMRWPY